MAIRGKQYVVKSNKNIIQYSKPSNFKHMCNYFKHCHVFLSGRCRVASRTMFRLVSTQKSGSMSEADHYQPKHTNGLLHTDMRQGSIQKR